MLVGRLLAGLLLCPAAFLGGSNLRPRFRAQVARGLFTFFTSLAIFLSSEAFLFRPARPLRCSNPSPASRRHAAFLRFRLGLCAAAIPRIEAENRMQLGFDPLEFLDQFTGTFES